MYLLVVLGDTVRVTGSGMGCASWPLCNGHVGLVGNYHALLEQSHRYLAALVSTLVTATFAAAWRRCRHDGLTYRGAAGALGLIGLQVVLGAITVWTHNAGWTVAAHLGGAWLVLAAVTVTATGAWRSTRQAIPAGRGAGRGANGHLGGAAVVALFAISLSGMAVLHSGASRACAGWPTCPGSDVAPLRFIVLQYLHRSLALVGSLLIVTAAWRAWRSPFSARPDRLLALAITALLSATAALGGLVATTGAPPIAQGLHLAVASALWTAVVALAVAPSVRR